MELPPFYTGPIPIGRIRSLSIFELPFRSELPDKEIQIAQLYKSVKDLAERAKKIKDAAAKASERMRIPIDEDENEVRAAQRRVFDGDGTEITFAQFRTLVDERKDKWKEVWKHGDFKGYGKGDARTIDRTRLVSSLTKHNDKETIGKLASFGSQTMIFWALNQLIGANHASDHSQIVSGKYPPGTEVGGILSQLIKAFIMQIYIQGMTEDAVQTIAGFDSDNDIDIQSSIKKAYRQAVNSPPPDSLGYQLFKSSMHSADRQILMSYSSEYIASKVGQGYETWWAYLSARDIEDQALRNFHSGESYRNNTVAMLPQHRQVVSADVNMGTGALDRMVRVIRSTRGASETCCFLRFLHAVDMEILEGLMNILEMSVSLRETNIRAAHSHYLSLANHPWNVISGEVLSVLDEFFDKVAGKILGVMDLESEGMKIAKACLPIDELIGSVLDVVEYTKSWYKQMVTAIGTEINNSAVSMAAGWDETLHVKKARESLEALKRMTRYKSTMDDSQPLEDNHLNAMISELQDISYSVNLEETGNTIGKVNDFTREMVDICRTLGDWDKIKKTAADALSSEETQDGS